MGSILGGESDVKSSGAGLRINETSVRVRVTTMIIIKIALNQRTINIFLKQTLK